MIEEKKLYPATILRSVKGPAKDRLFQAGIMLTKDLLGHKSEILKRMTGVPQDTVNRIMEEARKICAR